MIVLIKNAVAMSYVGIYIRRSTLTIPKSILASHRRPAAQAI